MDQFIKLILALLGLSRDNSKPEVLPAIPSVEPYKVTKNEILMGRDKEYPSEYTQEISDNIDKLLMPINKVRNAYGKPMSVNSGWRPHSVNANTPGAATFSNHEKGLAVDISDPDGELRKWVLNNLPLMKELGLYFEDFRWTATWVHFQCVPPGSGKRIYIPYADTIKNPMTNPAAWDGNYDPIFNS